ncbi:response regulator [Flavobacterium sp. HJSW_4]|uniref:response regulator n=1 Tax=Flavobacterium sp. HJSW_4 TaxID=3344660 RepID=UPI0035F45742
MDNQKNTHKILIVDDDQDDRDFLIDALLEIDPDIVINELADGISLMNSLLENSEKIPDIIFLDINMPGKSGLQCLKEIKMHNGNLKNVRVIMLSTSSDPSDIETAHELGASYYAVKPNSLGTMRSFLEKIINMDWNIQSPYQFRLI